ncbi:MAG: hypothetical protein ACOZQL_14400 [Myxococcota bacterium]
MALGAADAGSALVYVMQGPCDGGTCLANTYSSSVNFRATAGSTYTVVVDSEPWQPGFDFQLLATPITPPANDSCAAPAPLPLDTLVSADFSSAIDDYGATIGDGGVACGQSGVPDVVFTFTPPASTRYRFEGNGRFAIGTSCGTSCSASGGGNLTTTLTAGVPVSVVFEPWDWSQATASVRVRQLVPPGNDTCTAPQPLTAGVVANGSTINAADNFSCGSDGLGWSDVVYAFTPPATGTWSVRADGPAGSPDGGFYGMVYVTTGSCDGGCLADVGRTQVNFRATAAQPYFVVVESPEWNEGAFALRATQVTPPANDTCAAATPLLEGTPVQVDFTNAVDDSTMTGDGGCGLQRSNDVFFTFVPPATGRYVFQAPASVYVGQGCGSGGSCLGEGYYVLSVDLAAGVPYVVTVEGAWTTSGTVRVDRVVAPPNDQCTSPQTITAGLAINGTTRGAQDDFQCNFSSGGPDVAYRFTPTTSGAFTATATSNDGGITLFLSEGSCDGGCLSQSWSGALSFRATSSTPYFLVVNSYDLLGTDFSLRVDPFLPLSNDTCAAPTPLPLGQPVTVDLSRAFDDLPAADAGSSCGLRDTNDAVFSFTPTTSGTYVVTTDGFVSMSTTCGAGCTGASSGITAFDLTSGQTYFFVVESWRSTQTIRIDAAPDGGFPNSDGGFQDYDAGFPTWDGGFPPYDGGFPNYDAGFPTWDGGFPNYDAGFPTWDGGFPPYDGGFPNYDAGYSTWDSGFPPYDGGFPNYDGGFPNYDGGFPHYDGGFPNYDGGFPNYDGGFPHYDGGFPNYDGGFPNYDGGFPNYDGGFPNHDGGFPNYDGGFPNYDGGGGSFPDAGSDGGISDAGSTPVDAGTTADAGGTTADAGSTSVDAGQPDAGTGGTAPHGCSTTDALFLPSLLGMALVLRRRR